MMSDPSTENTEERRRCNKCHVALPLDRFARRRSGDYKKMCEYCLAWYKEYYQRRRCLHDKFLPRCEVCSAIAPRRRPPPARTTEA